MVIIFGMIVVVGSVLTGFTMAGGHVEALWHISEVITIGGAALGALIIMSPVKVLTDLMKGCLQLLKGSPYSKAAYIDLMKLVFELASVVRRDGILTLESHLSSVKDSSIFSKSKIVVHYHHPMHFLIHGLELLLEGRDKDAIEDRLETEIEVLEREHHAAIAALAKTADALPGFGIVAAVLGIVVTMGAIDGPVEEIGHKVGAALVGTFLGILMSYGFFAPLAARMEVSGEEEKTFLTSISNAIIGIQQGINPKEIVTKLATGIGTNLRPTDAQYQEIFGK